MNSAPRHRSHPPRLKTLAIPYRVPGYPWTPVIFVLVATAIVANPIYVAARNPVESKFLVATIALFLLGISAYSLWQLWRRRS
jgi:basic amino acid/polyamine antiporter, APA family